VSRGYFETLGIPIVAGRAFDERDRPGGQRVVLVNQAFAARYLAGRNAVGARVRVAGSGSRPPGPWAEIAGVAADARNRGFGAPVQPEIFTAMERGVDNWNQLFLLVRSAGSASALLSPVREAVRSLDPDQPVYAVQTLEEAIAVSTFQQHLAARLLTLFAAAALVLAAIGVYGVMSYSVMARTQEIGVRLAIGAQRRDVVWLVLRQVFSLAAVGVIVGVGLVIAGGGVLRDLLYGVAPSDPLTIAFVCLTLGSVALVAAWLPARRASRVDPVVALRAE
jgi:putative ABC transport system permease protein